MYLRRRAATAVLALSAVFAVSACTQADNGNNTLTDDEKTTAPATPQGGPQSTAPAGQAVAPLKGDLEAKDNAFVPKEFSAKAGTITFTMKNTGVAPHTFTNAELDVDVNANAGQSVPVEIKDAKPGTYHFVCKYHETVGMVGDLTVT